MKIRARFFARYRELVGKSEVEMEIEEGATVTDLAQKMAHDFPQLHSSSMLLAVNGEYVESHFKLSQGDEIAFLPPLSGG